MHAIESDTQECVQLLLEHAPKNVNELGYRPSDMPFLIAKGAYHQIMRLLSLQGVDVNLTSESGQSALWMLARDGRTKAIEYLFRFHPIIDSPNDKRVTPLIIACKNGHRDVVELLLNQGADIEWTDVRGNTPLIKACIRGHASIVRLLLEKGADVERTIDRQHITALMHACSRGHVEIVQILVEHGANVDHRMENGITARLTVFKSIQNPRPDNGDAILKILGPPSEEEVEIRNRWMRKLQECFDAKRKMRSRK